MDFKPKDAIALLSILAILVYKSLGHNGAFDSLVALIIGYYFGRRDDATVHVPAEKVKVNKELELQ